MEEITLHENERIDQLFTNEVQVIQSSEVFSFSLDAVLLAHFAEPKRGYKTKLIDFCAGNGAVGLFLSSKTKGQITSVEIQPKLAEMAQRSVRLNNLTERMEVLNIDLNDSLKYLRKDNFDTIVCNPPYFADQPTSEKNPNPYLAIARHEIKVNLAQIIEMSSALLKRGGKLAMIHRPERLIEIFAEMEKNHLVPKRVQLVYPKADKEANMVLVEAIRDGNPGGTRFLPPLTVYQANGEYTKEVHTIIYGE